MTTDETFRKIFNCKKNNYGRYIKALIFFLTNSSLGKLRISKCTFIIFVVKLMLHFREYFNKIIHVFNIFTYTYKGIYLLFILISKRIG